MAAGTVTITEERGGSIRKIAFAWTSGTDAAAGTASASTSFTYNGKIERLVTVPAAGGDAPTDQYDLTITDADGIDVLAGAGANRSGTNTEQVASTSLGHVANDKLTVNVSNAGAAKKGTAILFLR